MTNKQKLQIAKNIAMSFEVSEIKKIAIFAAIYNGKSIRLTLKQIVKNIRKIHDKNLNFNF